MTTDYDDTSLDPTNIDVPPAAFSDELVEISRDWRTKGILAALDRINAPDNTPVSIWYPEDQKEPAHNGGQLVFYLLRLGYEMDDAFRKAIGWQARLLFCEGAGFDDVATAAIQLIEEHLPPKALPDLYKQVAHRRSW